MHTISLMYCGALLVDKGRILTLGIDKSTTVANPSISFLVGVDSEREGCVFAYHISWSEVGRPTENGIPGSGSTALSQAECRRDPRPSR